MKFIVIYLMLFFISVKIYSLTITEIINLSNEQKSVAEILEMIVSSEEIITITPEIIVELKNANVSVEIINELKNRYLSKQKQLRESNIDKENSKSDNLENKSDSSELTIAKIIEYFDEGISAAEILEIIKNSKNIIPITSENIIELKNANVSEEIINELKNRYLNSQKEIKESDSNNVETNNNNSNTDEINKKELYRIVDLANKEISVSIPIRLKDKGNNIYEDSLRVLKLISVTYPKKKGNLTIKQISDEYKNKGYTCETEEKTINDINLFIFNCNLNEDFKYEFFAVFKNNSEMYTLSLKTKSEPEYNKESFNKILDSLRINKNTNKHLLNNVIFKTVDFNNKQFSISIPAELSLTEKDNYSSNSDSIFSLIGTNISDDMQEINELVIEKYIENFQKNGFWFNNIKEINKDISFWIIDGYQKNYKVNNILFKIGTTIYFFSYIIPKSLEEYGDEVLNKIFESFTININKNAKLFKDEKFQTVYLSNGLITTSIPFQLFKISNNLYENYSLSINLNQYNNSNDNKLSSSDFENFLNKLKTNQITCETVEKKNNDIDFFIFNCSKEKTSNIFSMIAFKIGFITYNIKVVGLKENSEYNSEVVNKITETIKITQESSIYESFKTVEFFNGLVSVSIPSSLVLQEENKYVYSNSIAFNLQINSWDKNEDVSRSYELLAEGMKREYGCESKKQVKNKNNFAIVECKQEKIKVKMIFFNIGMKVLQLVFAVNENIYKEEVFNKIFDSIKIIPEKERKIDYLKFASSYLMSPDEIYSIEYPNYFKIKDNITAGQNIAKIADEYDEVGFNLAASPEYKFDEAIKETENNLRSISSHYKLVKTEKKKINKINASIKEEQYCSILDNKCGIMYTVVYDGNKTKYLLILNEKTDSSFTSNNSYIIKHIIESFKIDKKKK